jgi:hypothetical protein
MHGGREAMEKDVRAIRPGEKEKTGEHRALWVPDCVALEACAVALGIPRSMKS